MSEEKNVALTIGECVYGEYDETEASFTKARGYLIVDAEGNHVAIVMGADKGYTSKTEGAAYARLIASAPQLLKALEAVAANDWVMDTSLPPEVSALVRAALAAAKVKP